MSVSWSTSINGSDARIAKIGFRPNYSVTIFDPFQGKVLLLNATALVIKNFSDQDITTYKITIFPSKTQSIKGNVTIIRAGMVFLFYFQLVIVCFLWDISINLLIKKYIN